MYGRGVERLDLTWLFGKTEHQRWHAGGLYGPFATVVAVGQLADGRWYAERHGRGASRWDRREGSCVYRAGGRSRRLAEDTAARWRRTAGGEWVDARA